MADKPVHTWNRGSHAYSVSLHGKVEPESVPVSVIAQELARMAVENATLREALVSARLDSPNVELHAAFEALMPVAESGIGWAYHEGQSAHPDQVPELARAKRALDRHKPRPIPEPEPPVEEPVEEDLTPPSFVEGAPV